MHGISQTLTTLRWGHPAAPRLGTGEACPAIHCLFDPERLIPLRHALGARKRANLELKHAPADSKVDDRNVLGLARARGEDCAPMDSARGFYRSHGLTPISRQILGHSWLEMFFKGIAAGFLIAAMVWVIPGAETAQFYVIVLMTYLISAGNFMHIVAGSVETFLLLLHGLPDDAHRVHFAGAGRQHRRRHGAVRADCLCAGHEGNLRRSSWLLPQVYHPAAPLFSGLEKANVKAARGTILKRHRSTLQVFGTR